MLQLRDPLAPDIRKRDVAVDGEDHEEDVGITIRQGAEAIVFFLI